MIAATAVVTEAAAASPEGARQVHDGCEVGGGGNDIQSVQTRYDQRRNRIVAILRLCADARRDATYRLHIDHAAPFVEEAAATAACANPADSLVARGPSGHKGVERNVAHGNLVRFFVPLDALGVGAASDVPVIPLWATSTARGVVDRVPNRETGDACGHPRSRSETLVQTRAVFGKLAWIGKTPFEGFVDGVSDADGACRMEAAGAGLSGVFAAWFSARGVDPALTITPDTGPFSTGDGAMVAQSVANLGNCTKGASGTDCLLAPIDRDIHGFPVPAGTLTWTGTLPNGQASGAPNCNDWSTISGTVSGSGGAVGEVGAGWTSGSIGQCNQIRYLICLQTVGNG